MDNNSKFRIPTNPIQERLQAQRNAISQPSSQPSAASSKRIPGIPNIPVIPPQSAQQQARNSTRLAPPSPIASEPSGPSPNKPASFPSLNSSQRAGVSSRKKVALEPGCSPLDWAKLNSSGSNLRGIDPSQFPLRVNKELLKQHNNKDDCWTVLKGKVYNITPYVKFHPGGIDEIMKCAGRDGTALFNKYHAWVNFERMLENCFLGFYVG